MLQPPVLAHLPVAFQVAVMEAMINQNGEIIEGNEEKCFSGESHSNEACVKHDGTCSWIGD